MYGNRTIRQLYKDIMKGTLSVYDSIIAWCANIEEINLLSFSLTVNNLNSAMQQSSAWKEKFSKIPKDAEVSCLEEQCAQKGVLADTLLGKIGDERNYTIHRNGDNEKAKEIIRTGIMEIDSRLRSYGKA
jgi:hypothetical protein